MTDEALAGGNEDASRSPIALIRDLQSGTLTSRSLSVESRRACVEHLAAEGWTIAEIAEVIKTSHRTIHRDIAAIRAANAIEPDEQFAPRIVGQLIKHAEQTMQRLRRITRERDCDPAVRVDAERTSWNVMRDLTEVLQRLGFLPTAPQQLEASILHRHAEPPSVAELEAQARSLQDTLLQAGAGDDETLKQLAALQDTLGRAVAAETLDRLTQALPAPPPGEEIHP